MATNKTQTGHANVHFSRSLLGGKKTSELKFRVSDELHDEIVRRGRELGFQSTSEYLEHISAKAVIGEHAIATFLLNRLKQVDQPGNKEGASQ